MLKRGWHLQVPQQLLEAVCTRWGWKEVVLDGDCDHFGGNVGPGIPADRPVPRLVLRVEPGRAGLVMVEEGEQIVGEFGQWC